MAMSSSEMPVRTTWNVEGDLTETLWWSVDESKREPGKGALVFYMIPGNPGVIDYYTAFLSTIFDKLDGRIEIVGVSHMGHSHGPHNPKPGKLYSLQDQIAHKIRIFDELEKKFAYERSAPPKFIICGHSVGAYVATQVLKARPNHGIVQVYTLFPTLQHILKTPNGQYMQYLFGARRAQLAGSFVQSVRGMLSPRIFRSMIRLFTSQTEPLLNVTVNQLLYGHVVHNTLYMAEWEMKEITDLEEELFRDHLDKFVVYFGKTDAWAPLEHYNDISSRFPDAKIFLCADGMPHAFVLGHSEAMGLKVVQWIEGYKESC